MAAEDRNFGSVYLLKTVGSITVSLFFLEQTLCFLGGLTSAWEMEHATCGAHRHHVESVLPKDLTSSVGTTQYYAERAVDFRRRNPGATSIPYYEDYGSKYQKRFLNVTGSRLSKHGQSWVHRTHHLLQEAIEGFRKSDPIQFAKLEAHGDSFSKFAFGTHASAYLQAGFCSLPLSDTLVIIQTPDWADLLRVEGISQGIEALVGCGPEWMERARKRMINMFFF